jgi:hypothetical protein
MRSRCESGAHPYPYPATALRGVDRILIDKRLFTLQSPAVRGCAFGRVKHPQSQHYANTRVWNVLVRGTPERRRGTAPRHRERVQGKAASALLSFTHV